MKISAPEPIEASDNFNNFDCEEESLNFWLKNKALKNHQSGTSKVFVIKIKQEIIGYYCLSAGAIAHIQAPKKLTRNSPDPLPIILLGRLAIDKNHKGKGLGADLLKDAIIRTVAISKEIGIVAIITHALNENAKEFYQQYGFIPSPIAPPTAPVTLILPLKDLI